MNVKLLGFFTRLDVKSQGILYSPWNLGLEIVTSYQIL